MIRRLIILLLIVGYIYADVQLIKDGKEVFFRKSTKFSINDDSDTSFQLINANQPKTFLFDKNFSCISSSYNIISLHQFLVYQQNKLLKPKLFHERSLPRKTFGILYRISKGILIDMLIDEYLMLVQHEVFGHGDKFREFNLINHTYEMNPFWPYGDGSGWAWADYPKGREMSYHEEMAISFNGSQSNKILSKTMLNSILQSRNISYRQALLYTLTNSDLIHYVYSTEKPTNINSDDGNDILNYLFMLNKYEYNKKYQEEIGSNEEYLLFTDDFGLTLSKLKKVFLLDLLNPIQLYSIWTIGKIHILEGKSNSSIPMFNLLQYRYLPQLNLGFTPFGLEYILNNYFCYNDKVLNMYVRYGEPTFYSFWGGGINTYNYFTTKYFYLDIKIDIWNQPSLLLYDDEIDKTSSGIGGEIILKLSKKIITSNLQLYTEIGYKNDGFIEGEILSNGMLFKIGLKL